MQTNKEIIRRFVQTTLNQGKVEEAGQYIWDDIVEQVPFPGQGPGADGVKDVIRQMITAFADLNWVIEEQIAEGDRVMTRFTWTGTHRAPFLGVPATGRPVRVWGVVIDRLEAGRIRDTRLIMDTLGMLGQLGVLPQNA